MFPYHEEVILIFYFTFLSLPFEKSSNIRVIINICPPHPLIQYTTHNECNNYPFYINNHHFSSLARGKHPQIVLQIFSSRRYPKIRLNPFNESTEIVAVMYVVLVIAEKAPSNKKELNTYVLFKNYNINLEKLSGNMHIKRTNMNNIK